MSRSTLVACCCLLNFAVGVTADWPQFRGPAGDGSANRAGDPAPIGLPTEWGEAKNVRWKTPIPHRGWSTPVAMDGRIWLTTAAENGTEFFALALDAETGRILHNRRLFQSDAPEPLGNQLNGYASPSPAVEADRVYVHFGSYGTACLDARDAEVLWKRDDLPCRHYRGPGSSIALHGNLVILTMDGVDQQYLVALDKQTGQTRWRTNRTADWNDLEADGRPKNDGDLRKSYSTPLILKTAGRIELLSVGAKAVYGYDPDTGRELWKVAHGCQGCGACPVAGHGLGFFPTGFGPTEIIAVRLGETTVNSESRVAWRTNKGMPRLASPVLDGNRLVAVSDVGVVSCFNALTGQELWKERIGGEFAASLLLADGRVYAFDRTGAGFVFHAGDRFEKIAVNRLDDGCMASPAVYRGDLILRTRTHLYRIGNRVD